MGVLNVTPDSFSDGGAFLALEDAVAHGRRSPPTAPTSSTSAGSRPARAPSGCPSRRSRAGSCPWSAPLVAAGVSVSIDTMRAETAEAAVEAGACSSTTSRGGLADPRMLEPSPRSRVPFVAMHWRGPSAAWSRSPSTTTSSATCAASCRARLDAAVAAGLDPSRVVARPGPRFRQAGAPQLDAARPSRTSSTPSAARCSSARRRKRFLGIVLADADGRAAPVEAAATPRPTRCRPWPPARARGRPGPRRGGQPGRGAGGRGLVGGP